MRLAASSAPSGDGGRGGTCGSKLWAMFGKHIDPDSTHGKGHVSHKITVDMNGKETSGLVALVHAYSGRNRNSWRTRRSQQKHRNAPSGSEYADPKTIFNMGINCSACQGAIVGARYRCAMSNEACKGVALCESCDANSIIRHPPSHPLQA